LTGVLRLAAPTTCASSSTHLPHIFSALAIPGMFIRIDTHPIDIYKLKTPFSRLGQVIAFPHLFKSMLITVFLRLLMSRVIFFLFLLFSFFSSSIELEDLPDIILVWHGPPNFIDIVWRVIKGTEFGFSDKFAEPCYRNFTSFLPLFSLLIVKC